MVFYVCWEGVEGNMKVEVLVSTMNQKDYSLLRKMNIQSDAIVVNQCDVNKVERFVYNGHSVLWVSLKERGVGLSRNTALMRARGDIVLFADDDVVYDDNYVEMVSSSFTRNKNIDLMCFNLQSLNSERREKMVKKPFNLHWYNCLSFGACRIAVRREVIQRKNLYFSLLFGVGAKYQAGEDNLFITQALKLGIRCRACSEKIGTVEQRQSTWFKGYNEKYYFDRGALFAAMYPRMYKCVLLMITMKERKSKSNLSYVERYIIGKKGARHFKRCIY